MIGQSLVIYAIRVCGDGPILDSATPCIVFLLHISYIFAFNSSCKAFKVSIPGVVIGHAVMANPSSLLGFGIMWKCTYQSLISYPEPTHHSLVFLFLLSPTLMSKEEDLHDQPPDVQPFHYSAKH